MLPRFQTCPLLQALVELLAKTERWDEARVAAAGRPDLLLALSLSHARWLERHGRIDEARQAYRLAHDLAHTCFGLLRRGRSAQLRIPWQHKHREGLLSIIRICCVQVYLPFLSMAIMRP